MRSSNKNGGFSLVEVTIALVIIGLMAEAIFVEYAHYANTKRASDTKVRRDQVSEALVRYLFNFHALPCPAAPGLPPNHPNAGKADCSQGSIPYTAWPSCDPTTSICVSEGARYTSLNPDWATPPSPPPPPHKDPILTGSIPYVDLGVSMNDTIDGWGNRMTYAVSFYLTDKTKFNRDLGVISQENYSAATNTIDPTPNQNLTSGIAVPHSYMLAIVSHGPDGKGAWNYNGQRVVPCDTVPIDTGGVPSPLSTGRDNENCNGDAIFLANAVGKNDAEHALTSMKSGPLYYDDVFVLTDIVTGSDKWVTGTTPNVIQNKLGGRVGIGTSTPTEALDVNGNIKADAYQADRFCDKATGNCFDQTLISPGRNCNDGLMIGVAGSNPLCAQKLSTSGLIPAGCPTGEYVTGIDSGGKPICAAP